jgi:hypothetical protein
MSAGFISVCLYYEAFSKDTHHAKKPTATDLEQGEPTENKKKLDN